IERSRVTIRVRDDIMSCYISKRTAKDSGGLPELRITYADWRGKNRIVRIEQMIPETSSDHRNSTSPHSLPHKNIRDLGAKCNEDPILDCGTACRIVRKEVIAKQRTETMRADYVRLISVDVTLNAIAAFLPQFTVYHPLCYNASVTLDHVAKAKSPCLRMQPAVDRVNDRVPARSSE